MNQLQFESFSRDQLQRYSHRMGIILENDYSNCGIPKRTGHWCAWSLTGIPREDGSSGATEKYSRSVGLLPGYLGFVPGFKNRFGKTFGNDTKDAKKWLNNGLS